MKVVNEDNIPQDAVIKDKVDANLSQQKVDTDLSKKKEDIKTNETSNEENNSDPNWRAFREARKKDRAEKEAAERKAADKEQEIAALKAAMEAAFSKSSPSPQAYQQYYGTNEAEESEDQRLEKKVEAMLAFREEKARKEYEQRELREYPNRLSRDFPDFAQVCTQENLDYLDYHYPELSRPLQRLQEGYEKWHDIYKAVKKFIPNHANAKKEAMRADINNNKPKSISSTGISNSGEKSKESWQESEQRRASNWERMQRVMKGI